ncbi:acetyl-CoA synthetase [Monoraphidium neglectum]|uniref:acetate--CoA ligase n=1 Tax=Monoraphidium neglectum TaxID=145388 RepID=A0A0D2KYJ0_9CHLO|nr:acetyl-CoA synthetase [Monoraphidium neglectum]KIZ00279.1 acetyl-CoA synthetase [Monoraphidium neglectum]|eukprot:XP_013899298.1 acetyl-CoA synthetase [Monoraphidium neglectum]
MPSYSSWPPNRVWTRQWDRDHTTFNFDLSRGRIGSTWFKGAQTNITFNCLDRWVIAGKGDRVCFISEGNDLGHERSMTYHQVLSEANWLRGQGVAKGDAVLIYMPMVSELPIAMLACARIGAVHNVVFAGFSPESMAQRIQDCRARVVITASGVMRGTKRVDLKALVDESLSLAQKAGYRGVTRVLVFEKSALPREETPWKPHRDAWWHHEVASRPEYCPPVWLDAEDPLFMLYTSGSTGKPKGVLHTMGGYMVHVGAANKYMFDVREGDVFWRQGLATRPGICNMPGPS